MTERDEKLVRDRDGREGRARFPAIEEPNARVLVRLDDGSGLLLDADLLEPQPDGSFRLAFAFDEIVARANGTGEIVIPVIDEEVDVEKRVVERGRFRIQKTVSERDVLVDQPLFQEHVEVERVPVNQFVDAPPDVRYEGDTMIVPVLEEVVVADIRLMVREEIHITRRREEVHEPQQVRVRREDVTVDPIRDDADAAGDANLPPA